MMMNKIAYCVLFILYGLSVSGCSTSPTASFNSNITANQGEALVHIYRGETKTRNSVMLSLNGEIEGKLKKGKYLTIAVPAGMHKLSARSRSFGYDATAINTNMQINVRAGETLLLKYSEDTQNAEVEGNYAFVAVSANLSLVKESASEYQALKLRISSL